MSNAKFTESNEVMGFDSSLLEGVVREFPFLVDFSLGNYVDVPHSLIAPDDGFVFLNELLGLFFHQLMELVLVQGFKDGEVLHKIRSRDLVLHEVVAFNLSHVVFYLQPHVEVELLIHSPLLVVFLEKPQLVVQQRHRGFRSLYLFHYLRKRVYYLRSQVGLSQLLVVGSFLVQGLDHRLVERELSTLDFALFNAGDVGADQVVDSADLLVDLPKSIVADDGELPQPEDEVEEDVVVLFRNEVVPVVHRLIGSVQVQIHALQQLIDGFVRALVVFKLSPEDSLQGYSESTSDFNHGLVVDFNFITESLDCAVQALELGASILFFFYLNEFLEVVDP
jgi:hypothetical protein